MGRGYHKYLFYYTVGDELWSQTCQECAQSTHPPINLSNNPPLSRAKAKQCLNLTLELLILDTILFYIHTYYSALYEQYTSLKKWQQMKSFKYVVYKWQEVNLHHKIWFLFFSCSKRKKYVCELFNHIWGGKAKKQNCFHTVVVPIINDLSEAGGSQELRAASIKNLEMLKTSQPRSSQIIFCLKITYSRHYACRANSPGSRRQIMCLMDCEIATLLNHTFIFMFWKTLTPEREKPRQCFLPIIQFINQSQQLTFSCAKQMSTCGINRSVDVGAFVHPHQVIRWA